MRVLITGVTGFVGSHLVELLLKQGSYQIHGTSRSRDKLSARAGLTMHLADPLNLKEMVGLLRSIEPQWIFHLAGYAHNGRSFTEPELAWEGNLQVTQTLFSAVRYWGQKTRILITSSGLIYGDPETPGEVFDEKTSFRPASPYAVSKAAADLLGYQIWKECGLEVIRARPFNQIGPGQNAEYAVANFARQIAAIESGKQTPVLETGNLSGQRDLTDVRDMVYAFVRLMERGQPGEAYNCATGMTYSMAEILDRLIKLSSAQIEIRQKAESNRQSETLVSRTQVEKLKKSTGWAPVHSLDSTLKDILNDWRSRN
ncbi:GDP-mannose 4,6-dehydratase [Telmatocola sphagniphila]|uniref:GDP-mannose 4,6-dehydratase n=1 Tax=Telmatocola sphagniphila TaxID=1123043 RepID=A0A8E6B615_9BACT|nr:GDP-mannose 4,6-dehydratase [Telmatocola sphagniphila]QVL31070.1 GDP-mannose 4,6-dehydratase [Telmatocola sphagniphila]